MEMVKVLKDVEMSNLLEEVQEEELNEILGAKKSSGAIRTVSHDCHMNSWQFIFTCCS
ncbi:lantibiotic lacticin [Staphylococcus felis]|uniref:Lantibiotic n=1 Tax=Staphylococcus felis TaxID=46127 RepID=A0AAX1RXJ3_9STAP|nr:lacticin 481 family lantibiotic [Staphylococcus felis]REH79979.1 lantibiotic lacticin [Staphylococcus felis]REH82936.1 lantibiotic lacticin [Staphylococcus felis]REH84950.1 lantibiotic lacticin [Staphylococcus felis]REH89058.1 lantibiotic lacticin [Staphylococcus felis]REH99891.1 lantibiotic lacticin [Staphylococcus felis]